MQYETDVKAYLSDCNLLFQMSISLDAKSFKVHAEQYCCWDILAYIGGTIITLYCIFCFLS